MLTTKMIQFITLSLFTVGAFAYDIPKACQDVKNTDCVTCNGSVQAGIKLPPVVKVFDKTFGELSFIEERVAKLDKQNIALKKSFTPLYRTLRDGDAEPTAKESRKEIALIKEDFDRLAALSKEGIILQRKFTYCMNNCSAYQKLEINDAIEATQKLKIALFVKRPILANKFFEEAMIEMKDSFVEANTTYPQKDFEKILKDALFDNFGKIDERANEYQKFEYDGEKPIKRVGNEPYGQKYIEDVASKFPALTGDILSGAVYNGDLASSPKKEYLCHLARNFKSYSDRKRYVETAVDVGLFIAPMLTGPLGFEVAMGARLAGWGLKAAEVKSAIKATAFTFQAGVTAKDLIGLRELARECNQKELKFLSNSDEKVLNEFRSCQKELGEKIFLSELGVGAAAVANFSEGSIKLLNKGLKAIRPAEKLAIEAVSVEKAQDIGKILSTNGISGGKNQLGMEFATKDSGVFSVLNLERLPNVVDPKLKALPETYWRYVGNVYNERLKLSPEEIENFIKSSVEMSSRTKLVINSTKSPLSGEIKINGGIGLVHSTKASDLLPLEKATGHRIARGPNDKIAEIVRLTVGKDVDAEKMSSLLVGQVLNLIKNDKDINKIYIFTSRVHARLYKKMGVPASSIKDLDKRDVLIEMDREVIENVIKSHHSDKVIFWIWKNGLRISSQAA